ncbi:DMT family transporter [Halopelagius longus]|uniref:Dolichyl-phosphate-mannose-protein mannosyltransferase n=1 Tax=Halopelagius longus TaxID=1236180 RepID=A0A1H1GIF2_9EURY|nr:hypothetical protein [Halopelagius longus]RDI69721.1 hypothetical protein DWB78_18295 [Halopelagius longus]SDR13004.1 hypothetical protein SAMN05216278_3694 [Halopelagius longus]
MKHTHDLLSRQLDVLAAAVGLIVAFLLFFLRFYSSQIYITTIPVLLGVACLLYLFVTWYDRRETELPRLGVAFTKLSVAAVAVGISGLLLLAIQAGTRSPLFLVSSGVVASLILCQALFTDEAEFRPWLLLAEITALAVVVRFVGLYTTPGFIGIDSWTHIGEYAASILRAGSLSAISDVKYVAAPLYHLLVVVATEFLGVSMRQALFLTVGTVMSVFFVLVYSISRFFVTPRWAVFAVGLFAVGDHVVRWGLHLIPTSLGLALFLGVVYALVRIFHLDATARDYGLVLFFGIGVILTHQVSAFVTLVLLLSAAAATLLFAYDVIPRTGWSSVRATDPKKLLGVVGVYTVVLVVDWMLTPISGTSFVTRMLVLVQVTLARSAGFLNLAGGSSSAAAAGAQGPLAPYIPYINELGFFLLFFLTVFGSLVVLNRSRLRESGVTLIAATVGMMVFAYILPVFGIRTFLPGRWIAFMYVPMVVIGTIGLYALARNLPSRGIVAAVVVFALVFPGAMLVADKATIDDPVFDNYNPRYSNTESELAAINTIRATNPSPSAPLYTDHPYRAMITRAGGHLAVPIELNDRGEPVAQGVTVYREYQSYGASMYATGEEDSVVVRDFSSRQICPPDQHMLYDNGDVQMCSIVVG